MRTYKYIAGLLVFAAVSMGDDKPQRANNPHEFKPSQTAPFEAAATYPIQAGTAHESTGRILVRRRLVFEYPEAQLDASKNLARDSGATITEYLPDKSHIEVDCRKVAREMVLNLTKNFIEQSFDVTLREDGVWRKYFHYYVHREPIDVAAALKPFSVITVLSAEKDDAGNSKPPVFRDNIDCQPVTIATEATRENPFPDPFAMATPNAVCGQLTVHYLPVQAPDSAVFADNSSIAGQHAYIFNPNDCQAPVYKGKMAFNSCHLLGQIRACGLGDVERGLAAKVQSIVTEEQSAREDGFDTEHDEAAPPAGFGSNYTKPNKLGAAPF